MQGKRLHSRIAVLPELPMADLKKMWWTLYDAETPKFNRTFLEHHLAYRLQEITYGGLSQETIETLKKLRSSKSDLPKREIVKPPAGVVLIREYQGIEHRVDVLRNGFEYDGKPYKSLTAIAYKITGTHWNGPRFFGLHSDRR